MEDEKQAVRVQLGPCTCPGTPHADGDWVELRPRLGMARALAVIRGAALADEEVAEMQLAIGYARFGIADWNLSNGDGKVRELDGEHLSEFAENDPRSIVVAMRGDPLYSEEVMRPLATMAAASSRNSSDTGSTSATTGRTKSGKPRKRSKQSSISTTRTEGTVTITPSLDGDSSS